MRLSVSGKYFQVLDHRVRVISMVYHFHPYLAASFDETSGHTNDQILDCCWNEQHTQIHRRVFFKDRSSVESHGNNKKYKQRKYFDDKASVALCNIIKFCDFFSSSIHVHKCSFHIIFDLGEDFTLALN